MLVSKNRISSSCVDELRAVSSGGVALPGHDLYNEGCRVWNGAVRRRPAILAFCRQPEDVQAADWAERALRDDGLVVDLTGMRDVAVDPRALVATVAGGTLPRMSLPPPDATAWSRRWVTAARSAWPA